jgi:hypothetical protein
MADQYHFGTTEAQRRDGLRGVYPRLTTPSARLEMRVQREIEVKRSTAAGVRRLIEELEGQATGLDTTIVTILAAARVRDPSDCAYPIEARTLGARRDNIKSTITALSGWLATVA